MHTLNPTEAAFALRDRDPEGGRVLAQHRWNNAAANQTEIPSSAPAVVVAVGLAALVLALLQDHR